MSEEKLKEIMKQKLRQYIEEVKESKTKEPREKVKNILIEKLIKDGLKEKDAEDIAEEILKKYYDKMTEDERIEEDIEKKVKKAKATKNKGGREHITIPAVRAENIYELPTSSYAENPYELPPEKEHYVIVDSWPMREVYVKVETEIDPKKIKVSDEEIKNILEKPSLIASYLNIIKHLINVEFFNYLNTKSPTEKEAENWLDTELSKLGLTSYLKYSLINFLIYRFFYSKKEFKTLDYAREIGLDIQIRWPTGVMPQHPITSLKDYLAHYPKRIREPPPAFEQQIDRNCFTPYYLKIPEGWYKFEAEEKDFDHWEIQGLYNAVIYEIKVKSDIHGSERYVRAARTGILTWHEKELIIYIDKQLKITAFYKGEAIHKRTTTVRARGYEAGKGLKELGYGALGYGIFRRGGIEKELKYQKIGKESEYRSPRTRAAINKGKRMLNAYARAEYTRIFSPLKREFNDRRENLKKLEKNAKKARKELRKMIRNTLSGPGFVKTFKGAGLTDHDLLSRAVDLMQPGQAYAKGTPYYATMQEYHNTLAAYMNAYDNYFKDLKERTEAASSELERKLKERARIISIQLARRFRIPLNSDEETEINAMLDAYASDIAEKFATRGRTALFAISRGIANISRAMGTVGDVWSNFIGNLWNIITGPWVIGTIMVILQFYFITMWIGYNAYMLFWIPLIGAIITFILNFEEAKQPLDWIAHLAAGAMISYSFVILFYALGITIDSMGMIGFVLLGGAIFILIGLFQFYQIGGFRVALQLTVICLIFGYIALGPYSGYWQVVKDQVKTPLNIAFKSIKNAVSDVWLLTTNPTEWYARQQLVNVKPEKPIDFPKGIEITMFDAIPASVPGGMEFAATAIFKNEGEMTAKEIKIGISCNQWCDTNDAIPTGNFKKLPGDNKYFWYLDENENKLKLERKEAETITFTGLVAKTVPGREAEFRMAKVKLEISYRYYTSASLLVDVINENELQRLFKEGKEVFRPVLAVEKATPAKLSLNVGPQPLKAGTKNALLLLSISNTRDDGEIKLRTNDFIKITLPKSIGSNLNCGGRTAIEEDDKYVLDYPIENEIIIKPNDFNSIYAILCSFDVNDIQNPTVTGLITAQLGTEENPGYEFIVKKEKDVPITTPLGIFYDPFERECKKCGDSLVNKCDKKECEKIKDNKGNKCWFRDVSGPGIVTGGECHSCSKTRGCSQFSKDENECMYGAERCELLCQWHRLTEEEKEKYHVAEGGANIINADGWCEEKPLEYKCSVDVTDASQLSDTKLSKCAQYFETFKKYWEQNRLKASGIDLLFLLTLSYGESSCSMSSQSTSGHGLMQIVQGTANDMCKDIGAYDEIIRDSEKNINCGTRIFYEYLNDVRKQGVSDNEVLIFTLFSYNRGNGAMRRAVELRNEGKDLIIAMRDACYEFFEKGVYGDCGGQKTKEKCCYEEGYGAKYPEKYIKIYNEVCKQLKGTIQTTPLNQFNDKDFCEELKNINGIGCLTGQGNCKNDNECCQPGQSGCRVPSGTSKIYCKHSNTLNLNLCCPDVWSIEDCEICFNSYKQTNEPCV
ncbi:MAG: transglycosylase SLT domain-containing protein [Candidatus Aenigmatarchaeota archaeon]